MQKDADGFFNVIPPGVFDLLGGIDVTERRAATDAEAKDKPKAGASKDDGAYTVLHIRAAGLNFHIYRKPGEQRSYKARI